MAIAAAAGVSAAHGVEEEETDSTGGASFAIRRSLLLNENADNDIPFFNVAQLLLERARTSSVFYLNALLLESMALS